MKVDFQIDQNEKCKPFRFQTWNGNKLISEKPAKILACYDVRLLQTGKVSVFHITSLENDKGEWLDNDDTIYENLSELRLEKSKIEYLIGEIKSLDACLE